MNYEGLAWVIDCEGSVIIKKRRPTEKARGGYQAVIEISMCDKPFLVKMKEEFKCGTLQVRQRFKDNNKHRDLHKWMIQNQKDTQRILENIEPYLIIKREKAKIILEFLKYRENYLNRKNEESGRFRKHEDGVWEKYEGYFRGVRALTPISSRRRHYG